MDKTVTKISSVLQGNSASIYPYGSSAVNDFRLGWSDIDVLILMDNQITEERAPKLVGLRQAMIEIEPGNPYSRFFERCMLTLDAILTRTADRVVYWGASGERITDAYRFDSLDMTERIESGALLYGNDILNQLKALDFSELYADVKRHDAIFLFLESSMNMPQHQLQIIG